MKRIVVVAATVVAVSLILAAVASARVATTIDVRGVEDSDPGDSVLFGVLDSSKGKCRSGRSMRLLVRRVPGKGGGFELADTARSSRSGGWGFRADLFGVINARIRVSEKKLGHGKGTCAAATRTIAFA